VENEAEGSGEVRERGGGAAEITGEAGSVVHVT
jgi:hypothetical protein